MAEEMCSHQPQACVGAFFKMEVEDEHLAPVVRLKLLAYNLHLVETRKEKGFTQGELAQLTGIPAGRIGEIELLRRVPTPAEAEEIASALEKPLEWLFPPELVRLIDVPREAYLSRWQIKKLGWVPRALPQGPDDASDLEERLKEVLSILNPREKEVITMRFGLDGSRPMTQGEVARELGPTRSRIDQIEAKALRKLRRLSRSKHLGDFLERPVYGVEIENWVPW